MIIIYHEESAIIPVGAEEIQAIRKILKQTKNRLTMKKEKNTFKIEAWVEPAENKVGSQGFGR